MAKKGSSEQNQAAEQTGGQAQGGLDPAMLEQVAALMLLDLAAVEAYEVALRVCKAPEITRNLKQFRDDHQRHVTELSEAMRALGVEPPTEPDDRSRCILSYTDVSAREDRTALVAMRGNEELTNAAYTSALAGALPEQLQQLIMANWQDERRHIEWIAEELRTRGWELPEVPPELVVKAA
jgi:competence protein ComEA